MVLGDGAGSVDGVGDDESSVGGVEGESSVGWCWRMVQVV